MLNKVLPWIVFIVLFALLIIGFSLKEKMNNYLSTLIRNQASFEIYQSGSVMIDSLYNYSANRLPYEITFLEFGAINCSACKRMETVMSEINNKYPERVNVVFVNILLPDNQNLMKLFGIAAIPTQVLLDRDGREFYRHTGYISANKLEINIDNFK